MTPHALDHPVSFQYLDIGHTGILPSLIGMMDQCRFSEERTCVRLTQL